MSLAQKRGSYSTKSTKQDGSSITWDLGMSFGSYGGSNYSQADIGFNWRFNDYLNWRNALFSRFGSSTTQASGLDSSLRYEYVSRSESGESNFRLFAGPGIRISNSSNTGVFGEAGADLKLGGLRISTGVKLIQYSTPGRDQNGAALPATDVTYSIIFTGGGVVN